MNTFNTFKTEAASSSLERALLAMDRGGVKRALGAEGGAESPEVADLADAVIAPAFASIGARWERGDVALSQVYMAARILEEVLGEQPGGLRGHGTGPRVGIGVLEDYHALGKRIVCSVLSSAGRDVIDLGTALSPDEMIEAAARARVDVLMISVLMFNKALHVRQVVDGLEARGLGHVTVIVGGAPFTMDPELWRRVGADAYGRNAADALRFSSDTATERQEA